jgi:UPF0755 protein
MKNDIIPPRPPLGIPPRPSRNPHNPNDSQPIPTPTLSAPEAFSLPLRDESQTVASSVEEVVDSTVHPRKPYVRWVVIGTIGIILLFGGLLAWYIMALRPAASADAARINVAIESGSAPSQISEMLQNEKVIRSKMAFDVYVRIHGLRNKLQAGTFSLSPADSTAQIVDNLTSGKAEQFDITFYPGATLDIASTSADKTPSHRQVLEKLGYSSNEITEAFNASYVAEYPLLFSDKPNSANIEGYIYGQTYKIASGSSVKQILSRTFAEYETQIKENNIVKAYSDQGLNLYEGITLASIIQREVPTAADQKQVAQVFLKRYREGGLLGSDVTYHYAADKTGVARDFNLNSPYNTRKVVGLPPGPIASPGISALLAVASPAPGDYVYFLSGDDNKTYFAHTNEEHEANIVNHCAYKCSLP